MQIQLPLYVFLLLITPCLLTAQLYLVPAQAWQERELANPAALHELHPAYPCRFLVGGSFRYKHFSDNPANSRLDDWWTAAFRIEHFAKPKAGSNGNWLLGGRWYADRFGATKLTHGSLRLGWQQTLSKGKNISSLTVAFRLGAESFRLQTDNLYFLQPGDPLQRSNAAAYYPVGGAGIFYQFHKKDKAWGLHSGLSLPALLHPDLLAAAGRKYDWQADLRERHGLLGGFFRTGNGHWLEWSAWGKMHGGQGREGSLSLRCFRNWESSGDRHTGFLWVGAGGSTYGYLHLEAGLLFDRVKVGFGYDWWLSRVTPIRIIPLQISLAWVGFLSE